MKDCDTCRHTDVGEFEEPCRNCHYLPGTKSYTKWEPQDQPAAASCENCGAISGAHAIWCRENAKSGAYVQQLVNANSRQVAGDHYKGKAIQPWDYIASNCLGYFEGNVVKYVSRWRDKGGVADLEKARHYLDKLIELESQK